SANSAPPIPTPPIFTPPVSTPPNFAPPVSTPPNSDPPVSTPSVRPLCGWTHALAQFLEQFDEGPLFLGREAGQEGRNVVGVFRENPVKERLPLGRQLRVGHPPVLSAGNPPEQALG